MQATRNEPSGLVADEPEASGPRFVVRVGDLVIDEQTGEILEYPDGWQGDLVEHLLRMALFAKQQQKEWDRQHDLLRFALGKKLEERNLERFGSPVGRVAFRQRDTRLATVERMMALAKRYQWPRTIVAGVMTCAKTFDPGKLEALAANFDQQGRKAVAKVLREDLIEVRTTRYVQVDPALQDAPRLDRHEVDGAAS
jgi:hypothetical protein